MSELFGGDFPQPRRAVLKQLGLAFGAGVLVANVAAERSPGIAGSVEPDQENFTRQDVEIESHDGTTIVATFYEPDAEGPHPALLGTHGWAGSRGSLDDVAGMYANAGYAGLIFDSRGFGESCGKVSLTGEAEQKDAQELITWLGNHEAVISDGPDNPRLGMDGGSYGGGIQTRVAAYDDRVDAIVPRYTWHDLTYSLLPNDVLKMGWILGLYVGGGATGEFDQEFSTRAEDIISSGGLTADDRDYFESRSTVGYEADQEASLDAPTLVMQAFNDRLFTINEGIANYEWAQDSGVESALLLGNASAHNLFGEAPPGVDTFDAFSMDAAIAWMDHHLMDEGDHGLAPVTYLDPATDTFVEAQEFPPAETSEQTFSRTLDAVETLDGPDAAPLTVDWEVEEHLALIGMPTLTVAARPTGSGPSNLMVALQRVSPDGVSTFNEQVSAVAIEEEATVTFDLNCIQGRLRPGETLRLALATRSEELSDITVPIGEDGLFQATGQDAGVEIRDSAAIEVQVPATVEAGPPPVVDGVAPRDLHGDGLYRDVRGDGTFDILDVQSLFDNLDNPAVQDNAEFFNFQGNDESTVTVLDVQALFDDLQTGVQ